jgi:hypothetical protein
MAQLQNRGECLYYPRPDDHREDAAALYMKVWFTDNNTQLPQEAVVLRGC